MTSIDDIDPNVCNMVHNINACTAEETDCARAKSDEIRECAVDNGMLTLQKYAEKLLLEGLTTVDEVLGVVSLPE